ncbi:hypothetical protein PTI45_03760 [Paenibacillus nuruki]|uniref:Uncharacterized protein n=1 Tax=Paenibacillus nuruki TaxID=1886670 RepID=A0A1E3L0A3_9BACL|nr:hypothetical protein [Paenibacillus nuruki]ODP27031.1 hypothetical protein PTI45_03760 [Paenibacillus nuruki]
MDNFEVVFDIHISYIDQLLQQELDLTSADIKSSHFYDQAKAKDIEWYDINSFSTFLLRAGTGTILFKAIELGTELKEVLTVISSDGEYITMEFNFRDTQLMYEGVLDSKKCLHMLTYFQKWIEPYHINAITFGHEPATDKDMCLIEITEHTVLSQSIMDQWRMNRQHIKQNNNLL